MTVITGDASCIGEATVELFIAEGAKVMIVGRNVAKGAEMVAALGANARFHAVEVRREADIRSAMEAAVAAFGGLDILFNNASGGTQGDVTDFTAAQFDDAMRLLLSSMQYGMKHVAPHMIALGWAAILNNSAVAALQAPGGGYLYSIARATPLLGTGYPRDSAAAALFLASEEGRFVNSHDQVVDAGMTFGGRPEYGPAS